MLQTEMVKEQESDQDPIPAIESHCGSPTEPPKEAAKSQNLISRPPNMDDMTLCSLAQFGTSDSPTDSTTAGQSPGPVECEVTESAISKTTNFSPSESTRVDTNRSSSESVEIKALNVENSQGTVTKGSPVNIERPSSCIEEDREEDKQEEEEEAEEKLKRKATSSDEVSDTVKPTLKTSPSMGSNLNNFETCDGSSSKASGNAMMDEAWDLLQKSYITYKGKPVGTLAAQDTSAETLNYNQVFVRDFVPSGLACLMKFNKESDQKKNPASDIVINFLLKTLHLQGFEKRIDNFTLGEGVMPASFRVLYDQARGKETLLADFGGSAIGRVAPVDSGFWWIILLRSYTKYTHDRSLAETQEVQRGIKLILNLCLSDGFDTFPTLLCADGCSMIDRRMGVYRYPIEIQALFYFALRCAQQLLKPEGDNKELIQRIDKRIQALRFHIREYYWLDHTQLNIIYRYKTEEYSHTAVNKFNVIPESIPDWVFDFMPLRGGYFIGNVSPARMDFRWFLVGNCIAILSSLATPSQATAIMDLVEERWEDLIGEMPLKITYPALEGHQWRMVTGFDPKNTRWSYHNGGSWPVLLWLLTAACIKTGRPQTAKRAIELVEKRISKDGWPEYYDGKSGRYIGKQARKYQTWSISGYLTAKLMIENPANISMISLEEDKKIAKPRHTRCSSF